MSLFLPLSLNKVLRRRYIGISIFDIVSNLSQCRIEQTLRRAALTNAVAKMPSGPRDGKEEASSPPHLPLRNYGGKKRARSSDSSLTLLLSGWERVKLCRGDLARWLARSLVGVSNFCHRHLRPSQKRPYGSAAPADGGVDRGFMLLVKLSAKLSIREGKRGLAMQL